MRIRYMPQTISRHEAEDRLQQLRADQASRDQARRRARRRAEIRANVVAAIEGALLVGTIVGFLVLVGWLGISGAIPAHEVQWK